MQLITLKIVETVLSFTAFVCILLWAYSGRRKESLDRMALLPFDDNEIEIPKAAISGTSTAEHDHV